MEYLVDDYGVQLVEEQLGTFDFQSLNHNPSITFLYVDDDPIDTWLAVKNLEISGIAGKVMTASQGEEGVKALQEYYEKKGKLPEVIIVDLQMPRMDGFELIRTIKKLPYYKETSCKIILISAGLDEEDIRKVEEMQIKNILLKPFEKDELFKILSF